MPEPTFQPGFRLSAFDVVVLVAGGAASAYTMSADRWLGVAIAFVVLHFFLFCNLLRMSRPLERLWAGSFLLLSAGAGSLGLWSWPVALAASLGVTATVALIELRRPSYHGVGWRTLNPALPDWWRARHRL